MSKTRPVIAQVLHRLTLAGAEVLVADLARRIRDRYESLFLCLDDIGPLGEQLRDQNFKVINLDRCPGLDWKVGRRIRRLLRQHDVALLHAHQYTPFFYAAVARGLGRRPPIIVTEHAILPE